MATRKQHYVTFYSPGTLFSEQSSREIDAWDTRKACEIAKEIRERYNAKPYGFRFETRIVADPISDGHGGTLKVESKTDRTSGVYFLTGELQTIDDVFNRHLKDEEILFDNMKWNDYPIICINKNSYRSTLPFGEDDRIVDWDGNIIEDGSSQKHKDYRKDAMKRFDWRNDK